MEKISTRPYSANTVRELRQQVNYQEEFGGMVRGLVLALALDGMASVDAAALASAELWLPMGG